MVPADPGNMRPLLQPEERSLRERALGLRQTDPAGAVPPPRKERWSGVAADAPRQAESMEEPPARRATKGHWVLVLAALAVVTAGAATLGMRSVATPAQAAAAPAKCTAHADTAPVPEVASIPAAGLHADPVALAVARHATTHGYLVILHRGRSVPDGLAALARDAVQQKIPLAVAPRSQRAAIEAYGAGRRMTCTGAGPAQVRDLRAFVAAQYPALAG